MLGIGILQNPMFGDGTPGGLAYAFPDYGAGRVVIDGAFSGSFHAWGELALALGWLAALGLAVGWVLRRLPAQRLVTPPRPSRRPPARPRLVCSGGDRELVAGLGRRLRRGGLRDAEQRGGEQRAGDGDAGGAEERGGVAVGQRAEVAELVGAAARSRRAVIAARPSAEPTW